MKRRRVRRFQISEIEGRRRKRANGYILQSKPGKPVTEWLTVDISILGPRPGPDRT